MLNEDSIKIALIDHLFKSKMLEDAVLINEMVTDNWSRRADIAVANGKLHAFEIKSDFDTLKRLDGQITTYLNQFDKVTVVTTSKHTSSVLKGMPDEVEVLEVSYLNSIVSFRKIKRGKTKLITNKTKLAGFLHKAEIRKLLKDNGIQFGASDSRQLLIEKLSNVSCLALRESVLANLKIRYKNTFDNFMANRTLETTLESLDYLSKNKLVQKKLQEKYIAPNLRSLTNFKTIDLEAFEKKFGFIPENMPEVILLKK